MAYKTSADKITVAMRKLVWQKATPIKGHPTDIWRRDRLGNVINEQEYQNADSPYGWGVQYLVPPAEGSKKDAENMEPVRLGGQ